MKKEQEHQRKKIQMKMEMEILGPFTRIFGFLFLRYEKEKATLEIIS